MSKKTSEREALEKEAAELDLKVPGNIGDEKLKERIEEAKAAQNGSGAADATAAGEQTSPQVTGDQAAPANNAVPPIEIAKQQTASASGLTQPSDTNLSAHRAPPEPDTDIFEVIDRVRHGGKVYEVGDPIELKVKTELPALIAAGVIAGPDTE